MSREDYLKFLVIRKEKHLNFRARGAKLHQISNQSSKLLLAHRVFQIEFLLSDMGVNLFYFSMVFFRILSKGIRWIHERNKVRTLS